MADEIGGMKELSGKVAIVTGSARNIGRASALELARAGASVMVHAKTSALLAGRPNIGWPMSQTRTP